MNPGTFLIKTERGRLEVAERKAGLSSVQRRILIVVDGKKTIAELGALLRADELIPTVARLSELNLVVDSGESLLLVEPVANGFSASKSGEEPRAATSVLHFFAVRKEASDFVGKQLGRAGEPICLAIDRCTNPEELRKLLRGVEIFVGQRLDAQTTQQFARQFGQMLL